jgi:hypothetical protein
MSRTKKTSVQTDESPARYSSAAKPVKPLTVSSHYWIGKDANGYYVTDHRDLKLYRSLAWLEDMFTCANGFPSEPTDENDHLDELVTEPDRLSTVEDTTAMVDFHPDDME